MRAPGDDCGIRVPDRRTSNPEVHTYDVTELSLQEADTEAISRNIYVRGQVG